MSRVKVKFDPEAFTDTFWKVEDVATRFCLVYGSSSSGKSQAIAQRTIIRGMRRKKRVLYIRKVAATVKDSIFADVKKWVSNFGLNSLSRATSSPTNIFLKNGTEFLFRGLDDPEKLKSISDIDEIVVEEATELTKADFFELNRRLRGKTEMQLTLMFNPTDIDSWIYQHFFVNKVDNCTIVHVTYQDNKYNSEEDIQQLLDMKLFDINQYNVYALGHWGNIKSGYEFFPSFNEVNHAGKVNFLPHLPVHLSFDFNVLPYQPMAAFQIAENVKRWENPLNKQRFKEERIGTVPIYVTQIRVFKNYAFKPPINDVDNVCQAFIDDYSEFMPDVFLYGDASGKNKVPGTGDYTNFKRIKTKLSNYLNSGSDRVMKANPSVLKSRDFMNKLFANFYPVEFIADEVECKELIKDLATVQLSRTGMLKEMTKDPTNKAIVFQKNGHFADLVRYLCVSVFFDYYKSNQ